MRIDRDSALFVSLDADVIKTKVVCEGSSSNGHEDIFSGEGR